MAALCKDCGTVLESAGAIGLYCPNGQCAREMFKSFKASMCKHGKIRSIIPCEMCKLEVENDSLKFKLQAALTELERKKCIIAELAAHNSAGLAASNKKGKDNE